MSTYWPITLRIELKFTTVYVFGYFWISLIVYLFSLFGLISCSIISFILQELTLERKIIYKALKSAKRKDNSKVK